MIIDLDYLVFIIPKDEKINEDIVIEEGDVSGKMISYDFIAHNLTNIIGEKFVQSGYYQQKYINKFMWLQIFKYRRELHFYGRFFLEPNYKDKIIQVFQFLKTKGYVPHISRLDIALTFCSPFEEIYNLFNKKADFKKLEVHPVRQSNKGKWLVAHNTRYRISIYDKLKHINRRDKKEYKEAFFKKFHFHDEKFITRIEHRFIGKDCNWSFTRFLHGTSNNIFFDYSIQSGLLKGFDRVTFPRTFKKLIPVSSAAYTIPDG